MGTRRSRIGFYSASVLLILTGYAESFGQTTPQGSEAPNPARKSPVMAPRDNKPRIRRVKPRVRKPRY